MSQQAFFFQPMLPTSGVSSSFSESTVLVIVLLLHIPVQEVFMQTGSVCNRCAVLRYQVDFEFSLSEISVGMTGLRDEQSCRLAIMQRSTG